MSITLKKSNFAKSTIGAIAIDATSISIASITNFPQTGPFMAVIWGAYVSPLDDSTREIVKATWTSGTTCTIVRAQESTTAKAWAASSKIAHIITAGTLSEIETAVNTKAGKFTELSDAPTSFTGQAGKVVKVNTGETELELGVADYLTPWEWFISHGVNTVSNHGAEDYRLCFS